VYSIETGKSVRELGRRGDGRGKFSQPKHIALDVPRGELFVTDCNNLIQAFSMENGDFLRQFSCPPSSGLAVHPRTGEVYVNAWQKHQVVVLSRDNGVVLRSYPVESGSMNHLLLDGERQRMYITSGDFVLVHSLEDGSFVTKFGGSGKQAGRFNQLRGLAIDE
jgi:DNA-binding beta-propeller fold protein YncE